MSKELRITATKEVPDDAIEQAHPLSSFKPEIDALSKALGVKVEAKIVTPSGPRAPRSKKEA
jgi:hypothetical protein